MFYLPSKFKYKYLFAACVIFTQLLFMTYVHNVMNNKKVSQLTIFDRNKLPVVYKMLINKISPSSFIQYSMPQRCSTYFDELALMDEHWEITDLEGMDYTVDILSPHDYYERKYDQLKQEYIRDGKNIEEINTKEIITDLNSKIGRNKIIEDKIVNSVSHLRVYGTCYIKDENAAEYKHCYEVESKLFPWLTFESPVFERWDGTEVNDFPIIPNYYQYEGQGEADVPSSKSCLLASLKSKFRGKGIVLSIDDHLVPEAVKLLKTLRFLQNELPIQFVHKGDLSDISKTKLIELGRSNVAIENTRTIYDYKQEIWFVDVQRCLQDSHKGKFYMYRNKWLAVLFNSFEEMILMDSDVVSFVKPEQYFKFTGYRETESFFFKDRETGQQSNQAVTELLTKLMPKDLENLFFNIPKVTNFTLNNKFFEARAYHYMESGVVVMNRKTHLLGLLISTQLQFWNPISAHTHGDKELFWLGQSFAGDENYYFNPNAAGAVGKIDTKEFKVSDVIVGTQPAHVGPDNQTLLWINSGFETCKKHSWEFDFENKVKLAQGFETEEELKKFYLSPLDIQGVIIPPDAANSFSNDENEPDRGWRQLEFDGCSGYLWGGYSKAGGDKTHKENSRGLEVRFDEETREFFSQIGHVWVNKDYYYNDNEQPPSDAKLTKYWKILNKFGNIQEYEKKINEDKKGSFIWEKWDDTMDLKLLTEEQKSDPEKKPNVENADAVLINPVDGVEEDKTKVEPVDPVNDTGGSVVESEKKEGESGNNQEDSTEQKDSGATKDEEKNV